MRGLRLVGTLMLVSLMVLARRVPPVNAQTPPVVENVADVDFPERLTFTLSLADEGDIVDATLTYDVISDSCIDAATQVRLAPEDGRLTYEWVFARSGNPPPGTQVWWEWTQTNAAGKAITVPRETITLTDDRFAWQTVSAAGIRVHWYRGETVGPVLLDAATASLERLQAEMGIQLQDTVDIFVYGSTVDMRDAVLYVQEWAGALAFADYNTILMGVTPSNLEEWGKPTIAHELAHLVVGQFARSCVGGSRPTWLEEGLAMVAEGEPGPSVTADLATGIADNTFEPVRSLNGAFSAHLNAAGAAYSQSYSLVRFLLDAFGQEKMKAYLLTLAEGVTYDAALEGVYGFNTDGLEGQWREHIGAQPRQIRPTPTPIDPDAVPTIPPLQVAQVVPTPPSAAATAPPPKSEPGAGICAAALIPLLLLTFRRSNDPMLER